MPDRKLLVTHHAPDLDAIGAVWILKRFDSKNYADARIAFVDPGSRLGLEEARKQGCELYEVTHVDTGLGRFDHHQPDRGQMKISATSLTFEYVCSLDPNLADNVPLRTLVDFVTQIDHFGEIHWPEASNHRYAFMIHNLIHGYEFQNYRDDDSQLHFGLTCLDCAYSVLKQVHKAEEIIAEFGKPFEIKAGKALSLSTRNDDTIKVAQKQGYVLVVKKDSEKGNIRIKARPDADINLVQLHEEILKTDTIGDWYYHPSGKMLINGSVKHTNQKPSPLTLEQVEKLIKRIYG